MKLEVFELAAKIREEINKLVELDNLLCNAANDRNRLAAIRHDCYDGHIEVVNEELLSQEMLSAFRQFINNNVKQLRDEFDTL
jgi:hypothetical protein